MAAKLRINVVSKDGTIERVLYKNICNNPKTCSTKKSIRGGHYICDHYNLQVCYPDVAKEWDYDRNKGVPRDYSPYSNKEIIWKCYNSNCECHTWKSIINNRTGLNRGCPYCRSGKPCKHNNLKVKYQDICKEWDYSRNNIFPESCSLYSHKKVWWVCNKSTCNCHRWEMTIKNRTLHKENCPYCAGKLLCSHNNIKYMFPDISKEWNYKKNLSKPEEYSHSAGNKVWWICQYGHEWEAFIYNRTYRKDGCPKCQTNGYSKRQIEWLNHIMEEQGIYIQHAENEGEVYIPTVGKVDGFCTETGTVYEFHGSFWHGHPKVCDKDKVNPISKIKNIELFIKTMNRDRQIVALGYNLNVMWEHNYKK